MVILLGMLSSSEDVNKGSLSSIDAYVSDLKSADVISCPHCGSVHVVRNGHRKDGVQKYTCKECRKHFVPATGSIYSGTHKCLDKWALYIRCMVSGMAIRDAAAECGISSRTSFYWHHKILGSLCAKVEGVTLEGISECDETYFPLSFKGNRRLFLAGETGRAPHKRGGAVHTRGLSKEQVCVPCGVDRTRKSISSVANLGAASTESIGSVLGGKFAEGSTICADKNSAYLKFAQKEGVKFVQLRGGKTSVGVFNIQHLNSYHSMLKDFMRKFKGVATKYLNGYLAWNSLLNYAKETVAEKNLLLKEWLVRCGIAITVQNIRRMNPVPVRV